MKTLYAALAGALLLALPASAQKSKWRSVTEYKTKLGTVLHVGDTLQMGRGTADNGNFRYAYVPGNILAGQPAQLPFQSGWNDLRAVVKDLRTLDSKELGSKTVAIIATGRLASGCVDIESAEEAREILTANNRKPANSAPPASVADELLKLKALLDAGAITQAEFDAQKAKLLGK